MTELNTIASLFTSTIGESGLAGTLRTVLREASAVRTSRPTVPPTSARGSGKNARETSRTKNGPSPVLVSEEDRLLLPDDIKGLLQFPLSELGFPLERNRIRDTAGLPRNHFRATVKGGYMAWLFMDNRSLENGRNALEWAWVGNDFARNGALGLFILSDAERIALAFDTMARQWEEQLKVLRVKFFDLEFTQDLRKSEREDRKNSIQTFIGKSTFVPSAAAMSGKRVSDLLKPQLDPIIEILSRQAATSNIGPEKYFKDLIARTNWPQRFKDQRSGGWTGNAPRDSRELIDWAVERKENPDKKDFTILGGLLLELRLDVGASDVDKLAELIFTYSLITDEVVLAELRP